MPTQAGYTSVFGEGMREAGSMFGSAIMETMGYENKEKAVDMLPLTLSLYLSIIL